jgi:chromosome segregation ATPase
LFGYGNILERISSLEKQLAHIEGTVGDISSNTFNVPEVLTELQRVARDIRNEQDDTQAMLAELLKQQREVLARLSRIENEISEIGISEIGISEIGITAPPPNANHNDHLLLEIREEFDEMRHHIDLAIGSLRGGGDD